MLIAPLSRKIWVTFQKEGIHRYPRAGTDPNLADVQFLQHPHRHMFHFKVSIQVHHDDRDIEFIQFKRWLVSLYDGNMSVYSILELNYKSCEMIADELVLTINKRYPQRDISVDVSEDGENGSVVSYTQPDFIRMFS